jgi:hypothetical protein
MILAGAAAATVAVLRHGRRAAQGHWVPGGILIGDAGVYDTLTRLLLGPLIGGIAGDVAAVAPAGAQVLGADGEPGEASPGRASPEVPAVKEVTGNRQRSG